MQKIEKQKKLQDGGKERVQVGGLVNPDNNSNTLETKPVESNTSSSKE